MDIRQSHLIVAFSALCAVALVTGIWGLISGQGAIAALVFAVVLLVIAQLVLFVVLMNSRDDNQIDTPDYLAYLQSIDERLERLEYDRADSAAGYDLAAVERSHLKNASPGLSPSLPPQPREQGTVAPPEPRTVVSSDSIQVQNDHEVSNQPQMANNQPMPENEVAEPESYFGPYYLDDTRLSLFLEPVVEVDNMQTGFYRAELSVLDDGGLRHFLSQLEETITQDGNATITDLKLFARLGPVIERLVQKRQVAGVICPISRFSFANETFLRDLTRQLQQYPDLARLMVIEVTQSNLAGLSQEGMAGLAFLAQAGATFCLGGAGLESPDLASLHSLGFRYLDLDYDENITRYGFSAFGLDGQAMALRDMAHQHGMAIIGSGLDRKSQADALNRFIDFGRGKAFSPPRLVRTDLGDAAPAMKAA